MSSCATTDPHLRCSKGRRCLACIERDAAAKAPSDGMTTTNSSSILRTLFGLRGRRR